MNQAIYNIFGNWEETILWSCLQGVMGQVYLGAKGDAAMAELGDFAFYAGKPDEELLRFNPEGRNQDFMIMIPQNEAATGIRPGRLPGMHSKKRRIFLIRTD